MKTRGNSEFPMMNTAIMGQKDSYFRYLPVAGAIVRPE